MGSAAHFGRIYWCGKRPAVQAYNGPFLSWVDLPANMSLAHPQVVKPLGITSGKIPDSAINATSERGNYEARNIRYVKKPFLPCKPLFELAIMRDPLAITTFLWSRSARSNNLITGSAKEVTYSACSQHATRAVYMCLCPHLSLPLITTPPVLRNAMASKEDFLVAQYARIRYG